MKKIVFLLGIVSVATLSACAKKSCPAYTGTQKTLVKPGSEAV